MATKHRFGTITSLALVVALAADARADFSFSVGNYSATGLGNPSGSGQSDFDKLTLTGRTGTFSLASGATTTITLSDLLFQTGEFSPQGTFGYTTSQSLTVDGITSSIIQPYTVNSSSQDTLTIQDGAPVEFSLAEGLLTVTPLGYGPFTSNTSSNSFPGILQATVSLSPVPEPSSIALLGLGGVGLGLSWRRRALRARAHDRGE